jgi:hypothetical protein
MDTDPAAQTSPTMDLGASSAAPSLNGYGSSHQGDTDVFMVIGIAFVGGLLLGALVTRLAS